MQSADFFAISHFSRPSDGGDTPSGLVGDVEAVGLERDYGLVGGRGEFAAAIRSDDDVTLIKGKIDKLNGWHRPPSVDNTPNAHGGQQLKAFVFSQLRHDRAVGVHSRQDAGKPNRGARELGP